MFESNQHVPDCRVRKTGKQVLRAHGPSHSVDAVMQGAEFVPIRPPSSLFGTPDKCYVFFF